MKYEFVLVHEFESKTIVQRARFPEKRRKKNRRVFICKILKGDTTLGVFTGQGGVQGRVFEDIDF